MFVRLFKPAAAIGDPPAQDRQRQREKQAPDEGQQEISQQAEREKQNPEDFSLHAERPTRQLFPSKPGCF